MSYTTPIFLSGWRVGEKNIPTLSVRGPPTTPRALSRNGVRSWAPVQLLRYFVAHCCYYALRVLIRIIGQLDPLQHSNPMLSFNAIMPMRTPMIGGVVYTLHMIGIGTSTSNYHIHVLILCVYIYGESYMCQEAKTCLTLASSIRSCSR